MLLQRKQEFLSDFSDWKVHENQNSSCQGKYTQALESQFSTWKACQDSREGMCIWNGYSHNQISHSDLQFITNDFGNGKCGMHLKNGQNSNYLKLKLLQLDVTVQWGVNSFKYFKEKK